MRVKKEKMEAVDNDKNVPCLFCLNVGAPVRFDPLFSVSTYLREFTASIFFPSSSSDVLIISTANDWGRGQFIFQLFNVGQKLQKSGVARTEGRSGGQRTREWA